MNIVCRICGVEKTLISKCNAYLYLSAHTISLSQVGEGLCPRGEDSSTMNIYTSILGNNGDLYVGGTFESRVWDGKHFANVFHVAHFDGESTFFSL